MRITLCLAVIVITATNLVFRQRTGGTSPSTKAFAPSATRPLMRPVMVLLAGLLLLPGAALPASAQDCPSNFPWASQQEMADWVGGPGYDCQRNFVTDPGRGNLLDRDSSNSLTGLLRPDRVAFYESKGFSKNFLWYAPRRTTTVSPTDTRQWTACNHGVEAGEICQDIKTGPMGPDFDGTFGLEIIGNDQAFISLACGNYRVPVNVPDISTPTIEGVKFRDNDRDGSRDPGEQLLPGWEITLTRVSSEVGQSTGVTVATTVTGADGSYSFELDGHGPGRYRVTETIRSGWANMTSASFDVVVPFGAGNRVFQRDFGNAETVVDVAKTEMTVDGPEHLEVGVPAELTVSIELANFGPAHRVAVRDELELTLLNDDCAVDDDSREWSGDLVRDDPVQLEWTFTVTCDRPSEHGFRFDDTLVVTEPGVTDIDVGSNTERVTHVTPVHAYTRLGATASLVCDERTDVDVQADCTTTMTITNEGFGPIDASGIAQLAMPADCASEPPVAAIDLDDLGDGEARVVEIPFSLVCTQRSFHAVEVSVAVRADDIHVFDSDATTEPSEAEAGDGPSIIEVFNDATMAATDVHLTCDATVGATSYSCTAVVDYAKTGPAPDVQSIVTVALEPHPDCAVDEATQTLPVVLDDEPRTSTFTWELSCPPSDVLHPASVTADVNPDNRSDKDPHAVDEPGRIGDDWEVPYCIPTVNPHGNKEPQAPGTGMNEDGFYVFGTLGGDVGLVAVRDDATGVAFGPFQSGTRIKWVEANGTEPSLSEMGGNNGNGSGQALAVDYQVRAQGDAQAVFVDERGVEVAVTCLVPNPPK